jgi:hypothetical protein
MIAIARIGFRRLGLESVTIHNRRLFLHCRWPSNQLRSTACNPNNAENIAVKMNERFEDKRGHGSNDEQVLDYFPTGNLPD